MNTPAKKERKKERKGRKEERQKLVMVLWGILMGNFMIELECMICSDQHTYDDTVSRVHCKSIHTRADD